MPIVVNTSTPTFQPAYYMQTANPSFALCMEMQGIVMDAIKAALQSGVKAYHVGSRGLERYTLQELQAMLEYWIGKANDALMGGSSMKVKRGIPCDV
jgi:hypothetical protein